MSMLDQISKGRKARPRRVMVYGPHGIGKSTFGAMAEKPIFIPTEDGLADIDCESFPLARSLDEVVAALESLHSGDHNYRTVVIDSLDWLERLIWAFVCRIRGVKSIAEILWGKGYEIAVEYWREVLSWLDALRAERGMQIIMIAHAAIEKFNNPETDAYDRYAPRLHKHASALVQEWCDEVLFACYQVATKSTDEGFNRRRVQGVGKGERVLRTTERPAHVA
ncbi:MAG: oxidoreductase, partial [Hyphomicrobium sp.]|nr:oxidoreductase [Hyphomicrobium sp.]